MVPIWSLSPLENLAFLAASSAIWIVFWSLILVPCATEVLVTSPLALTRIVTTTTPSTKFWLSILGSLPTISLPASDQLPLPSEPWMSTPAW